MLLLTKLRDSRVMDRWKMRELFCLAIDQSHIQYWYTQNLKSSITPAIGLYARMHCYRRYRSQASPVLQFVQKIVLYSSSNGRIQRCIKIGDRGLSRSSRVDTIAFWLIVFRAFKYLSVL